MTFLLQKFHAINRTRAEARARNGLRSPASGIAFTGRFAACLLLAGFLGVGSAMAQTSKILRVGGGEITINLETAYLDATGSDNKPNKDDEWGVSSYKIGAADAVLESPAQNHSFLVGGLALASIDANGMLKINPIAAGSFTITVDPNHEHADNKDITADDLIGIRFIVMSANAPELAKAANNAAAQTHMVSVTLIPRDDTSAEVKLLPDQFNDPNDILFDSNLSRKVDQVVDEKDKTKMKEIVTATISNATLTVALTARAVNGESTNIWVFATDGAGEYARLQVQVKVGSEKVPFVNEPLKDMTLRENAEDDLVIADLGVGIDDPDGKDADMTYEVTISGDAEPVGKGEAFTWVTSYMVVEVTGATTENAAISIRPRAPGSATFTVKATDTYKCSTGYDVVSKVKAATCTETTPATGETAKTETIAPDFSKGASDSFTVTVITRTTPKKDETIPPQSVVSDKKAITVDLADVSKTTGNQPAFEDPSKTGLTYTATAKDDIVIVSVDGAVITLTPIWRSGDKSTDVTVTATNALGETAEQTFTVTVKSATLPILNPKVVPILAVGFTLNTGDAAKTVDLMNVLGAKEAKDKISVFIDPDASATDALPGGLLLEMKVIDVVADHVYVNQSTTNDVYTSAMRITLDPQTAMLTIVPTAANSATVTVRATDRGRNMIEATTTVTVVSGVGTESEELPTAVELLQNYPNPFNPQTTIDYALPQAGDVSLIVYDMLGREVDVLLDGPQAAGRHTVRFGANHLPNGTYVYRLVAAEKTITRTMVLLK